MTSSPALVGGEGSGVGRRADEDGVTVRAEVACKVARDAHRDHLGSSKAFSRWEYRSRRRAGRTAAFDDSQASEGSSPRQRATRGPNSMSWSGGQDGRDPRWGAKCAE
jgi:hypothetical protein